MLDLAKDVWREFSTLLLSWVEKGMASAGVLDPTEQGLVLVTTVVALVIILLLLAIRAIRARRKAQSPKSSLARVTRGPRALGYLSALVLIAGFGGWSVVAPLASAALAPGVVSPDGNRKTVQHLEGGIIQLIHVREGDAVKAGQAVVTLDNTQAQALYEELRQRLVYFLATEARLLAEQLDLEEISFPAELLAINDSGAASAMSSQEDLFGSRRSTERNRESILGKRVNQLEEQINGLREVIEAQDVQLSLIDQEIDGVEMLYRKGLERLPRLLALQRAQAEIRASQAGNRAQIARHKQEIGETRIQILTMRDQYRERVNEELTTVRTALAELRSQLSSREHVLSRTVVYAPISGTVMNVRITTESGVIEPGQPLLDIVPGDAQLIIDAQVKPVDIENVRPGMDARIILTAYRQRNLPQIFGVLRSISADRLVEDRSGEAYYLAKVEVDADDLARLDNIRLIPGMPADVMILNSERTFVDYMLRPLFESINKSFRES